MMGLPLTYTLPVTMSLLAAALMLWSTIHSIRTHRRISRMGPEAAPFASRLVPWIWGGVFLFLFNVAFAFVLMHMAYDMVHPVAVGLPGIER